MKTIVSEIHTLHAYSKSSAIEGRGGGEVEKGKKSRKDKKEKIDSGILFTKAHNNDGHVKC